MAYNTFGRYRHTIKDGARRVRMNRVDRNIRLSLVSSSIPVEKLHPSLRPDSPLTPLQEYIQRAEDEGLDLDEVFS